MIAKKVDNHTGVGKFQTKVFYRTSNDTIQVPGFISRINRYGQQLNYNEHHHHKNWCYCKSHVGDLADNNWTTGYVADNQLDDRTYGRQPTGRQGKWKTAKWTTDVADNQMDDRICDNNQLDDRTCGQQPTGRQDM